MRAVSGLDVHKDSMLVCIFDEYGKKSERIFGISTREVNSLSATLKYYYVNEACMESPGIYCKPIRHLLANYF